MSQVWMERYAEAKTKHRRRLPKIAKVSSLVKYAKMVGSGLRVVPCGGFFQKPKAEIGWLAVTSSKGIRPALIGGDWSGHIMRVTADFGDSIEYYAGNERNRFLKGVKAKSKILCFIAPAGPDKPIN